MCEPCGRERQLRDAILEALSEGKKLIFAFAPTGYGKTRVSPYLLHSAREKGLASRLIHVVPTRVLVREIYEEKFKEAGEECGIHAAYQSLDMLEGGTKSPYFLAELVVTTLESFIMNAFKLPPAEFTKVIDSSTEGHYYPSVLALLSSIVVFDEAHLYIAEAEGKPVTLVVAAARTLLKMNVPVVILTATMPIVQFEYVLKALEARMDDVKVLYVCPVPGSCKQAERIKKEGYDMREIQDDPQRFNKIEWETSIVSYEDALKKAKEKCENELVLWVSNTVDGAVRAFDQLDGCRRVLIHGRLSERDKRKAKDEMEKLKCNRKGIIVASPIAEVGLDVDATTLISEAASMESLVQRAGRLYRQSDIKGGKVNAEVVIYRGGKGDIHEEESEVMKEMRHEVIKEIGSYIEQGVFIDWRSPTSLGGRISYVELMEKIADKKRAAYLPNVPYAWLFEGIVGRDSRPRRALESVSEIENLGALLNSLSLVKVKVGPENDDYVIISTNALNPEWIEWETRDEEGKARVKVEAIVWDPDGGERREIYFSEVLANVLRSPRGKGSRYMDISHIRKIRDELQDAGVKRLQQRGKQEVYLTVRDYFLIGEKAYGRRRGLGVGPGKEVEDKCGQLHMTTAE